MSDVTKVEAIYLAATERTDPAEREAYLNAACGADMDLRRRVDELLAAQPKLGQFLESNKDATHAYVKASDGVSLAVGQLIDGRYKLLERIGEGGMGEVWVADQLAPVRRRVAVKLIKPGMDSRGVLARFEAERQALAVMDHPNIAKVLDAGTTADGWPYFVMELVRGTPITEFADTRKLTPKERLELFVPVCQAIQHAHQKGVIHRDIKPSNVLVELHDDRMVPKVIDFGVAKAVGQPLTDKTIYTGLGALVGTPAYMAPEQASFNALDIDTRADVYALGVLLYELLAGSPPVESERLKKAALDEVLRLVREEEPPRPSQRLSTSQAKASIAAVRGLDPGKLSALMRGELDWIVMKALEKDRSRRYDTATALAKDVQRYINGDAVEACPPTLGYRLRKAYRRNRAAVLVGLTFAIMLTTATISSSWLAVRALQAEKLADMNANEAVYNLGTADAMREQADQKAFALEKLSKRYLDAMRKAELRTLDTRLDADLLEYKSDPRIGLLRLARPLDTATDKLLIREDIDGSKTTIHLGIDHEPEFVKLREFQSAAVISAGQEYVPLVPPLMPGIPGVKSPESQLEAVGYLRGMDLSPDGKFYVGSSDQIRLELVKLPEVKRVGLLRERDERVSTFGFTPNSQTIWTQDTDSIVRFWNTDGTLRAKTPLRSERFIYPAGMTLDQVLNLIFPNGPNKVLVTDEVALLQTEYPEWEWETRPDGPPLKMRNKGTPARRGPSELYSTRTGQLIRRLERPGKSLVGWHLSPDKRWLMGVEKIHDATKGTDVFPAAVIYTGEVSRDLVVLEHPGPEPYIGVNVSPTGKWFITYRHGGASDREKPRSDQIRLWRTSDWQDVQNTSLTEVLNRIQQGSGLPKFVTDDLMTIQLNPSADGYDGIFDLRRPGSWIPPTDFGQSGPFWEDVVGECGGQFLRRGRVLANADTLRRIPPPQGRKYATELAKLARDGRFFENLDTVTEKELPCHFDGQFLAGTGCVSIQTTKMVKEDALTYPIPEPYMHILPDPSRLDIPPAMLELWTQVVVGGELGPDGRFQSWDQPTWAAKQRELAAFKPPYADFPFPGWAAKEPNLWYRIRANEQPAGPERDRLLNEWHRRSGQQRPKPQPDTWRTPGPTVELAPTPRVVK